MFCLFITSACIPEKTSHPAPVTLYGHSDGPGSAGIHTVSRNENLWRISKHYALPMQDIIRVNKLRPPFTLDVGERLRLPPPRSYKVRPGDTLYGISRIFDVGTNDIARLNRLSAPYVLSPGQELRMPAPGRTAPAPAQTAKAQTKAAPGPAPSYKTTPPRKPTQTLKSTTSQSPPPRSSSKFLKPVPGRIISSFGPKEGGLHNDGINIAANKGARINAAENGVVVYAGSQLRGFGNLVLIRHADRWMTAYGHMDTITVAKGQTVNRGERIGTVGMTGSADRPQLHFEVRRGTSALNPAKFM